MRLDPLHRKLFRDVVSLWSQVVAIGLIVSCGIASYVAMQSVYQSMRAAQAAYYAEFQFADIFVSLRRAPAQVAERIRAIPGVSAVESRVVLRANLDVPGMREPSSGLIVSIPEGREPRLNRLFLRRGRLVGDDPAEVVLSDAFAQANRLDVGDHLGAVINGRWQRLHVVGIALSPEFVYDIAPGSIFPDNRRYGTLWMGQEALGSALAMKGAVNNVTLTTMPGSNRDSVIAAVDRVTAAYGGSGAYTRDDQTSNRFVSDEILQLRGEAIIIPGVFLGIAVFLLNMLLSRLVQTERSEIAILKALGYSDGRIALHYLEFAWLTIVIGSLVGAGVGAWLGRSLVEVYTEYFRFPVFRYDLHASVVAAAVMISAASALLGALRSVREVLALPPAEAMRAPAPGSYRPTIVERLGFGRFFAPSTRMMFRNIERKPLTALFTLAGVACATAILIVGRFTFDSIDRVIAVEFDQVQREDATIVFSEVRTASARFDLEHLPGVIRGEAFRIVPVRLRAGSHSHRTSILSFDRKTRLHRLVGSDLSAVALPERGIVLGTKLAQILGVSVGDWVEVGVLEGDRRIRSLPVTALIDEPLGTNAYMDTGTIDRLLDEDRTSSGAWLTVDSTRLDAFDAAVKRLPTVASSYFRKASLLQIRETIAKSLGISGVALVVIAAIIAFAVLYNAARIALSERARELSTLRIVGLTRTEIALLLLGEYALLVLAAIPLGFLLGHVLARVLSSYFDTELYRLPLTISPFTYGFAGVVIIASIAVTGLLIGREIDRLDLVAVLKARE